MPRNLMWAGLMKKAKQTQPSLFMVLLPVQPPVPHLSSVPAPWRPLPEHFSICESQLPASAASFLLQTFAQPSASQLFLLLQLRQQKLGSGEGLSAVLSQALSCPGWPQPWPSDSKGTSPPGLQLCDSLREAIRASSSPWTLL